MLKNKMYVFKYDEAYKMFDFNCWVYFTMTCLEVRTFTYFCRYEDYKYDIR